MSKVCNVCGTQNPDNAVSCGNCGNQFQVQPVYQQAYNQNQYAQQQNVQQPVNAYNTTAQSQQPYIAQQGGYPDMPQDKKKKSKGKMIIAIVCALLVAAAIAVGAILIFGSSGVKGEAKEFMNAFKEEDADAICEMYDAEFNAELIDFMYDSMIEWVHDYYRDTLDGYGISDEEIDQYAE